MQVIRVDDPNIVVRDGVAWWEGEPVEVRLGDVFELTEERSGGHFTLTDGETKTVAPMVRLVGEWRVARWVGGNRW